MQRHGGASLRNLVSGGFHDSRIGMPKLSLLAGHAEARVQGFGLVLAVVDPVDLAIGQLAMHE